MLTKDESNIIYSNRFAFVNPERGECLCVCFFNKKRFVWGFVGSFDLKVLVAYLANLMDFLSFQRCFWCVFGF